MVQQEEPGKERGTGVEVKGEDTRTGEGSEKRAFYNTDPAAGYLAPVPLSPPS